MARLVILNDDGTELSSAEIPAPLDTTDPGRFLWPTWAALVEAARKATGREEGVIDAPSVVGTLVHAEWRQRFVAGAYRGVADAAISIIEQHTEDGPKLRRLLDAAEKEDAAARKEIAKLHERFGDLIRTPTGRIWKDGPSG